MRQHAGTCSAAAPAPSPPLHPLSLLCPLQVAEFLRRLLRLLAIRMADLLAQLPARPTDPALLLTEVRQQRAAGGQPCAWLPCCFRYRSVACGTWRTILVLQETRPPSLLLPLLQAFTLAQHVAFEHTWLLYGRHADQVMLCCLYAVCKVGGACCLAGVACAILVRLFVRACLFQFCVPPAARRTKTSPCLNLRQFPSLNSHQARQLDQVSLRAILTAYGRQPQARPETFKSGGPPLRPPPAAGAGWWVARDLAHMGALGGRPSPVPALSSALSSITLLPAVLWKPQ